MYKTATKPLNLIAGAVASLALFSSASAVAGKPDWANKSDATIVESAVALSGMPFEFDDNGDDFDILVAAVVATGYFLDPLNGEDDYTVFAPNDDAFLALTGAEDVGMDGSAEDEAVEILVGLLGLDGIRAVLDYHVTEGVRNSRSVTRAQRISMLDGNSITATGGYVEAVGSEAGFVGTDIRVADGMIHVIDTVLLPFEL